MNENTEHGPGLRPTRRHGIILAFVIAVVAIISRADGLNTPAVIAVLTPWLLGTLIVVFDRPGPVRNWVGPLLLALCYPIVALSFDWVIVSRWYRSGEVQGVWLVLALNAISLGAFSLYAASMLPGPCPACGHRSLIPLRRLWRQERRSAKTRWCASCGAKYWKDPAGTWQPERRKTWLDAAHEKSSRRAQAVGAVGMADDENGPRPHRVAEESKDLVSSP